MLQTEQTRYEQCIKELNSEFEHNNQFVIYFNNIFEFYKQKFWKFIKEKPLQKEFGENFFTYSQQLFIEGYFMVDDFIQQPNTEKIPNEFLAQPNGIIQQQVFDILNSEQGLEDIISLDQTVEFEAWVLDNYEKAEHLLFEVKRDIILLGGAHRFIKEREKQEISIRNEPEERVKGIIHRSDDLFFVVPQKYLACVFTNPTTENWTLFYWSTLGKEEGIGNLTVQKYLKNDLQRMFQELPQYEMNKPTDVPEKHIVLTLTLEKDIHDVELYFLCSTLIQAISKRQNIIPQNIHLHIAKTNGTLLFQTATQ